MSVMASLQHTSAHSERITYCIDMLRCDLPINTTKYALYRVCQHSLATCFPACRTCCVELTTKRLGLRHSIMLSVISFFVRPKITNFVQNSVQIFTQI